MGTSDDGTGTKTYSWSSNGKPSVCSGQALFFISPENTSYLYTPSNRLRELSQDGNTYTYKYNGRGDRLQQTVNSETTNYTLDLARGLTQVLDDGTHTYLYGNMRLAQQSATSTEYFLTDALGSVRQMVDETGELTLAQAYQPYGETLSSVGNGATSYGFTGEATDATGLIFLRARYYVPGAGRFISKDLWQGDYRKPLSYNKWLYAYANPVRYSDPSGYTPDLGGFLVDGYIRGWVVNMTTGLGVAGLNLLHGLNIPLFLGFNLPLLPNLVPDCFPIEDLINVVAYGQETVYDFVHGEKQDFRITYVGVDFLQLVGGELSLYQGLASGFRNRDHVSDYGGVSISLAPPLGFSFSAGFGEVGLGTQSNISVSRPGVDSVTFGMSFEVGLGIPGPLLEEGASGSYISFVDATPLGSKTTFNSFSELESELQNNMFGDMLVDSARFWWMQKTLTTSNTSIQYLPIVIGGPFDTIYLPIIMR